MKNIQKLALSVSVVALLSACATPTVVQPTQANDANLSCTDIKVQMSEAKRYEEEARSERGFTGKNVAAVLLFWPALIGTYMNTEDALRAARERQTNLMALSAQKHCN
jgi:hypothetical protein